jgi:transcriptional regulator with XRE-family HTH domain
MDNLSALRKRRGLSQKRLARLLQVSRTIVQCWERGAKKPRVERFVQLAQVLDVSQETLAAALGVQPGDLLDEQSAPAQGAA